jgi:hypothetical protein
MRVVGIIFPDQGFLSRRPLTEKGVYPSVLSICRLFTLVKDITGAGGVGLPLATKVNVLR